MIPEMTAEYSLTMVRAAIDKAHSVGITAVIEPGLDEDLLSPVIFLADADELDLRVVASLSPINWQPGSFDESAFDFLARREQWRRPNIDVDSVKIYMDGVIEYGTSPLLEPYADEDYGSGEIRLTVWQNLLVPGIADEDVHAVGALPLFEGSGGADRP